MLLFVFGAFIAARLANLSAQRAKLPGVSRAAGHELCGETANIGAVPIEFDTARHCFHVLFLQARRRAMFARGYAVITSFDTAFVLLMWHKQSPLLLKLHAARARSVRLLMRFFTGADRKDG